MAYEYRKQINDAVRGLQEGEKFQAPTIKGAVKTEGEAFDPLASKKKGKYKTRKDKTMEGLTGEAGQTDIGLLARMAVGSAIGATQGDTLEERLAYMLTFGLGAGLAPRAAKRLALAFKSDPTIRPLLDKSNPLLPGATPPVEPTAVTTKVVNDLGNSIGQPIIRRILTATDDKKLTPEELKAGARAENVVFERLSQIADDMLAGRPTLPGELKNTMALGRTLNDIIYHEGRKIGATGTRGLDRVKVSIEAINKLAREWDPQTPEIVLAHAIKEAGVIKQVPLFTRLNYAIPEAITQAGMGAMLAGKAIVKNGIGNTLIMPISQIDRSIAALKFWDPARPMLTEGMQMHIAMWEGVIDQLRVMKDNRGQIWAKLGEQADAMGATHVEFQYRGFEALSQISREQGLGWLSTFFDYTGALANLGPGIMARTDGMAKVVNGRMAIVTEAMQAARAKDLKGDAFWNRVQSLKDDYSQFDEAALARIKKFSDHNTFTTKLESEFLRALQRGPEDPWANLIYRLGFLPFVRTPIRLLEIGAEYTPGLNFFARNFYKDMAEGGATRAVAEARLVTGAAVMGAFATLAYQGYITGVYTDLTPGQKRAMEDAGMPEQSFWDPLAGKYRSYKGIEPLTQWISTGATFARLMHQLPQLDAEHLFTAASVAISSNVSINQFMQSIGEFANAVKQGTTEQQYGKMMDFIRHRLTIFIPGAVKEITGSVIDEEQKRIMRSPREDIGEMHRELRQLMDEYNKQLGGAVPGLPKPYLKVKRNMFTGDVLVNENWPFNPFTTKPAQGGEWALEIQRLGGAGLTPLPDTIGKRIPIDLGLKDKPTPPGVRITPKELDRWEVLMTQVVKDSQGNLVQSLDSLVKSKFYKDQSEIGKKEAIQARWLEFKARAEDQLLRENPELARDLLEKQVTHSIERMPTKMQPGARATMELILRRGKEPSPGAAP